MVKKIDLKLIEDHPQNPRKNVGDVTELSASIKEQGLLQQLTVIKHGDKYRLIIGHRRAAAARLAKLKEVECNVVKMSEKDQIATMLSENIQRSDLTPVEEAYGIQQMMELGETVKSIAKQTGITQSLVKNRAEIAKLDLDEASKAYENKVTIELLIKVASIQDEEIREKTLEDLAEGELSEYEVNNIISKEMFEAALPQVEKILDIIDIEIKNQEEVNSMKLQYSGYVSFWEAKSDKDYVKILNKYLKDEDEETLNEWIYATVSKSNIQFYKPIVKKTQDSDQAAEDNEPSERKIIEKHWDEIYQKIIEKHREFLKNLKIKDKEEFLATFTKYFLLGSKIGTKELKPIIERRHYSKFDPLTLEPSLEDKPENILLAYLIMKLIYRENGKELVDTYDYYDGTFNEDEDLKHANLILEEFGYETSAEEKAIIDGTHELYVVAEDDEDDEGSCGDFEGDEDDE
ncbi:MAG: ParB/RepB/Spo0J family partition protein [Anaerovoracaceae bacterium]